MCNRWVVGAQTLRNDARRNDVPNHRALRPFSTAEAHLRVLQTGHTDAHFVHETFARSHIP
jgi:hypothetical protein